MARLRHQTQAHARSGVRSPGARLTVPSSTRRLSDSFSAHVGDLKGGGVCMQGSWSRTFCAVGQATEHMTARPILDGVEFRCVLLLCVSTMTANYPHVKRTYVFRGMRWYLRACADPPLILSPHGSRLQRGHGQKGFNTSATNRGRAKVNIQSRLGKPGPRRPGRRSMAAQGIPSAGRTNRSGKS